MYLLYGNYRVSQFKVGIVGFLVELSRVVVEVMNQLEPRLVGVTVLDGLPHHLSLRLRQTVPDDVPPHQGHLLVEQQFREQGKYHIRGSRGAFPFEVFQKRAKLGYVIGYEAVVLPLGDEFEVSALAYDWDEEEGGVAGPGVGEGVPVVE